MAPRQLIYLVQSYNLPIYPELCSCMVKCVGHPSRSQPIRTFRQGGQKDETISRVALVVWHTHALVRLSAALSEVGVQSLCSRALLSFPPFRGSLFLFNSLASRLWIAFSSQVLRESAGVFQSPSRY